MLKDHPDHHDADLVLRMYDLRREAVMRQSRSAINRDFWPKTFDDVAAVTKSDHPLNAPFRQTSTYWEMVYGMAKHGIVDADFLAENNGEGIFLYARVAPFLEQLRRLRSPREFQNAEWITTRCETGRRLLEHYRARVAQVMASR